MTLETGVKELAEAVGADVKALANDPRLTDSREWSADTVTQAEAEAGTASTRRAWTAQRVRQAINAWWQLVTSGFGRNFIAATNEQAARNVLQLGTTATANLTTSSTDATLGRVLKVGDGGWLGNNSPQMLQGDKDNLRVQGFYGAGTAADTPFETTANIISLGAYGSTYHAQLGISLAGNRIFFRTYQEGPSWNTPLELYSTGNLLNIGATAATARTALNLFTDSSGIITNGSGALTNDVSDFLSLNTYADMSVKIQGTHNYVELPSDSTSSTPMAGYYYLLPRNNEAALTHTFTCTYSATTVKTWRVLVSRTWSTSVFVSPNFAVTGLSGSVKIYGTFQNAMTNVLIEFTQIGQNVTGQIVSQWS